VSECDLETSKRRRPRSDLDCYATGKERKCYLIVSLRRLRDVNNTLCTSNSEAKFTFVIRVFTVKVVVSVYPFKDEACLFYIRTQCVPRCKHSPPRL
jgi:hypothetical protein